MSDTTDAYHPPGDVTEVPLLRIVWMGENGVNEQPLNTVLTDLANLATAGQGWWFGDRSASENGRDYSVLEDMRLEVNDLTRILVDVLEVSNRPHGEKFAFRFGQCIREDALNKLRRQIEALIRGLQDAPPDEKWDLIRHAAMSIRNWSDETLVTAYKELQNFIVDEPDIYRLVISDLLREKLADESLQNLKRIERSAESTLDNIDTAAGKVGAKTLAKGFSDQLDIESKRAYAWTAAVVLTVILGIALPVAALTTEKIVFSSVVDPIAGTAIKAIIGLPFLALAAYFARISSQHRETERYLRILVTQIDSVQAYAAVLDDEERRHLIVNLGNRAFADPGLARADKGKVGALPEDVTGLLTKALDLVAKNQGSGR